MDMTHLRVSHPTLAAAIMSTAFVGYAVAQENTMDAMVVTASGFEQEVKNAPASISVVTREQLEQGAYQNLHDAIRDIPGIALTPSDNNSNDISIRGMGANYTLILIDGKRQNTRETQVNGSTGTDESWIPPLEAIERIEVVRGPMSSLYGSDAMGGVINVITRKVAKKWTGSLRAETTIQGRSESGNIYQSNFFLSGPIKHDVLGLSVYGKYKKRNEDKILNGYNKHDDRGITAKFSLTPNKNNDFIFEVGTSKQNYVSTPGLTLASTAAISDRDFKRDTYAAQHKGRFEDFSTDTSIQYESVENISRKMKIENTTLNSSWIFPVGDSSILTAGIFYNSQDLVDKTTNTLPGSTRTTADRKQYAFFAENELKIVENFTLTTGARYDHDSKGGGQVSPRVYGVWDVSSQWTVKGGVSTGFRAPSLRQTLGDWGQGSRGGNIYGNPDLKPEKSLTKEIGVIYTDVNSNNASITLFDNKFKDKITRVECQSCGPQNSLGNWPTKNVNIDDAVTRGVELTGSLKLTENLRSKASYTHTKTEQKSGPQAGRPLTQQPRNIFNISLDWKAASKLNTWAKASYRGAETLSSGLASSGNFVQKSYTLLDVGGGYKYSKDVTFYAGIYNILNKKVIADNISYDTVLDGRRYWLGVNIGF